MCGRLMVRPTKMSPARVAPTCATVSKKSCQARMSASVILAPRLDTLTRRHSDGAVQTHAFAVEVAVGDHLQRKRSIFRRIAQTRRERHLRTQCGFHLFGSCGQQRRVEDARKDRVHADAFLRKVARDG